MWAAAIIRLCPRTLQNQQMRNSGAASGKLGTIRFLCLTPKMLRSSRSILWRLSRCLKTRFSNVSASQWSIPASRGTMAQFLLMDRQALERLLLSKVWITISIARGKRMVLMRMTKEACCRDNLSIYLEKLLKFIQNTG